MQSELGEVVALLSVLSMMLMLLFNTFLSIKLRKERSRITNEIVQHVPDHMQERIRLVIDSNMSWVFGSLGVYLWFVWPMLKFGWHVSPEQLVNWKRAIRHAYGKYFLLAYTSMIAANIAYVSFITFIFVKE